MGFAIAANRACQNEGISRLQSFQGGGEHLPRVGKVPQPTNTVPIPPKDEKTDAKDSGSNMGESPGNEKKKPSVPFVETPSEKPRQAPETTKEEPKREDPGKGKETPPKKSPEKPKVPKIPQVPTLPEKTEKTEKESQTGGKEQPREGGEGTQKEPKKRPKYASCDDEETANAMESLMG